MPQPPGLCTCCSLARNEVTTCLLLATSHLLDLNLNITALVASSEVIFFPLSLNSGLFSFFFRCVPQPGILSSPSRHLPLFYNSRISRYALPLDCELRKEKDLTGPDGDVFLPPAQCPVHRSCPVTANCRMNILWTLQNDCCGHLQNVHSVKKQGWGTILDQRAPENDN